MNNIHRWMLLLAYQILSNLNQSMQHSDSFPFHIKVVSFLYCRSKQLRRLRLRIPCSKVEQIDLIFSLSFWKVSDKICRLKQAHHLWVERKKVFLKSFFYRGTSNIKLCFREFYARCLKETKTILHQVKQLACGKK